MADEWIKMRHSLRDDPAVFQLSGLTGLDVLGVVGRLYAVWEWFDRHTEDGRAEVGVAWVDRLTDHQGFAAAMVEVGWLSETGDGLALPGFDRHNGSSAKRRAKDNARKGRGTSAEDSRKKRGKNAEEPRKNRGTSAEESRKDCGKSAEGLRNRLDKSRGDKRRVDSSEEEPPPVRGVTPEQAGLDIGDDPPDPPTERAERIAALAVTLAERAKCARSNASNAARDIVDEADRAAPDANSEPDELIAACLAVARSFRDPPANIGGWRYVVLSLIRSAAENGHAPQVYKPPKRLIGADRVADEKARERDKIVARMIGGES